jgi:hypothetical protein
MLAEILLEKLLKIKVLFQTIEGNRPMFCELTALGNCLLLFGLIQKEAKRPRTSNRPARMASAPPWMFGPTHVGKLSLIGKSVDSLDFCFEYLTEFF